MKDLHEQKRLILIVGDEKAGEMAVHEAIRACAGRGAEVLVIGPALNTRVRHWTSDQDAARRSARERLDDCLAQLAEAGIAAHGVVGDADPVQAIADEGRLPDGLREELPARRQRVASASRRPARKHRGRPRRPRS